MTAAPTRNPIAFLSPIYPAGVICAWLLQIALFARPGPYGGPYVLDTGHYLPYALIYECYGMGLALAPFLLIALVLLRADNRAVRRMLFLSAACVVAALLIVGHINHELQRFMGIRLSSGFFATYARREAPPEAIIQSLADDDGGAWLSALLLAVPLLLFPWLVSRFARLQRGLAPRARTMALAGLVGLFLASALSWTVLPNGANRMDKVAPAIIALDREWQAEGRRRPIDPAELARDSAWFRRSWLAADASGNWAIPRPAYPYWRHCLQPPPAQARPNIILLVLETFRAKNMRSFSAQSPEAPTPFLDALAASPQAAIWPRYYTNGVPTAYAMLALDTSVPPHSSAQVSTSFTGTQLDGFAGLLRTAGYRTLFYTAADPDWDNQRFWLRRWFDRIDYDPANRGHDRPVFRHAAQDLLAQGAGRRPFFAIVQSMSNHPPFRSPEARFARASDRTSLQRINATMRYTDDVIREFYQAIGRAPWFASTIFVVTGDHGLDIGDRGASGGLTNLRHETNWVPLIMARPAGLPVHGAQPVIGSHVDLGPTLLDLAGLCPDMAATGHSLFGVRPERSSAFSMKNGSIALETQDYSLFLPVEGGAMLYNGADRLQQHDIAAGHPAVVQAMTARARSLARLNDALLDSDRIRPR